MLWNPPFWNSSGKPSKTKEPLQTFRSFCGNRCHPVEPDWNLLELHEFSEPETFLASGTFLITFGNFLELLRVFVEPSRHLWKLWSPSRSEQSFFGQIRLPRSRPCACLWKPLPGQTIDVCLQGSADLSEPPCVQACMREGALNAIKTNPLQQLRALGTFMPPSVLYRTL